MKTLLQPTDRWWMILRHFPPEPFGLWRLYITSVLVTLLLFSIAGLCAYDQHGWKDEPKVTCKLSICSNQTKYRDERLKEEREDSKAAQKRIQLLKEIRLNPKDENFARPWNWFETEIDQLKKTIAKPERYRMYSLSRTFLPLTGLICLSYIVNLVIGRLVILHAKSITKHSDSNTITEDMSSDWVCPHVVFGLVISCFLILAELSTSVLDQEKTWFGWDSFCVTPSAFIIKCVALISFGLATSTPFTVLWCLSKESYIPRAIPSARDGRFGAGRYVDFLQTWALWLVLAPATLGIIWMRYAVMREPQFSSGRLLMGVGPGVIITLIVIRLIRNAIILRFRCHDALCDEAIEEGTKQPTDPTIRFLGTEWWKLPATVTVALGSIWTILGWLGMSGTILDLIR